MATEENQDGGLHFLDYWRVIRSRKEIVMAVVILVTLSGTLYTLMLPKIFMAGTTIRVREDAMDIEVFDRQLTQAYNPFFLRTEFEVIQSRAILSQVLDRLNLQQRWSARDENRGGLIPRNICMEILEKSVRVTQYRDTTLIEIQVYRDDAEEAMQIANEIAEVYRDYRQSLKRSEIRSSVQALENELLKQQQKVNEAEEELERIRSDLGVITLTRGIRADNLRLQQMEADRISARVDMLTRKARVDQLEALEGEALMNASAYMVNDPALLNLRRQLAEAEVQLKLMLETMAENHPEVRRTQAGVDELRQQLLAALSGLKAGVRADYEVALARFRALDEELSEVQRTDIEAQREKYLPFERAERNLMIQQEILNALRARFTQKGVEMELPRTMVQIVDRAELPQRPVRPRVVLNIILSLVVGLGAGVGLAYFIEYLDTSVKTVDDVEKYLGMPVIGIIPQKVRSLAEEGPESPHAESYRVLRTNMMFANENKRGGVFAVVSGGVGEGKSTTLFNLAYICAQMGDKVLVIDSDMRRPVQHTFVNIPNRFGLTNVLMQEATVQEAIKPTKIPNLDFLPSGKLPRTSVGILEPVRLTAILKELRQMYDFVFMDSPPIVGVSDASIISSCMDGVLLVVQYRKYPRNMSTRAKRMLENAGAKALGVVLNNINILRDDYYYYYHSYHYSEDSQGTEEKAVAGTPAKTSNKDAL
ncbi:MAG TPA: polysaccharide biosynthesis tyrosine autokinase [Kiritimatiellia bacterium]|nr:polysaccharide biosynthesis tyrosine autokinase [Kiritimatiellia bacterium]HMO99216.1 polysaccharide biosynthesis tyrosine autokinase [Kiritimatiellia bacterium]HMP96007.1 polysaccharide biosynthesis tyrosine autokinase [Kiritimatiellia bacterium]